MIKSYRFEQFKSFVDAEFYLENITTLIGTNASGKSNAIEGMRILSELATGLDLTLILDGSKSAGGGIRGGSQGCLRNDHNWFSLRCCVDFDEQYDLEYHIVIEVAERVFVMSESLLRINRFGGSVVIFETNTANSDSADIAVKYRNQRKGKNPVLSCMRSSSVLSQMRTKMPTTNLALKENLGYIEFVTANLTNMLFLNPMPSEMRDYVRNSEIELKPNGENISAVLRKLCEDKENERALLEAIKDLPENEIQGISFIETSIGDVILALDETFGGKSEQIDAKRLSDGTLRCLAILTAILTEKENSFIVIEEIDNGIHPSRAKGLVDKISEICRRRNLDILMTTHNATILNSLSKENLAGVTVAYRSKEDGGSKFKAFLDISNYVSLLTGGGLGMAAEKELVMT